MPDMYLDVDTAVTVPVNVLQLLDDTTFKDIEESIAYDESGMDLNWNFVTSAGVVSQTNVTPTTGGVYDWTHVGNGIYKIEIPASGGGSINNDTEGYGWFTGVCDGVLPWCGPRIGFRAAALNDALCDGGDLLDVNLTQIGGVAQSAADLKDFADTGYNPTTHVAQSDLVYIHGSALTEGTGGYLAAAFVKLFDVATPLLVASTVMRGTDSANTSKTGYTLTNLSDANAAKLEDMLDGTGATLTLSNNLEVDLVKIHGSALTETAGQLAARFSAFFDQAASTFSVNTALSSFKATTGLSLANGSIVAATFGADCITAAKIADNAFVAANFAASSLDGKGDWNTVTPDAAGVAPTAVEIQAEMEENGASILDTLRDDLADGGRLDLILDAILAMLDNARAEPSQGAPPVNPDAMTKLDYLFKAWRNKSDQDASTYQLYADDASTVDQKATVSEAAGTVTKGEVGTGP